MPDLSVSPLLSAVIIRSNRLMREGFVSSFVSALGDHQACIVVDTSRDLLVQRDCFSCESSIQWIKSGDGSIHELSFGRSLSVWLVKAGRVVGEVANQICVHDSSKKEKVLAHLHIKSYNFCVLDKLLWRKFGAELSHALPRLFRRYVWALFLIGREAAVELFPKSLIPSVGQQSSWRVRRLSLHRGWGA